MSARVSARTPLLMLGLATIFTLGSGACGSSSDGGGGGGAGGKDAGCTVGALGCPCTSGGACDPGGVCDSTLKICVTATGTGGGSDGGGGSAGAGGASGDGGEDADASGSKQAYRFVSDSILLPAKAGDFAIDLDGDGIPDNALGGVFAALDSQGFDLQSDQSAELASGKGLELFRVQASDPTLGNDPTAISTLLRAVETASPDLSGGGSFDVDVNFGALDLAGVLANGTFTSNPPATGVAPSPLMIHLAMLGDVPMIDAHVSFSASPSGLAQGRIEGAITQSSIDSVVIPALAQYFDALAHENPCSSKCDQSKQLFDADQDGNITVQEIQSNSLIQSLLAPDVDLLDASDKLNPNPAHTNPDSLSLGIGFTAVTASFSP